MKKVDVAKILLLSLGLVSSARGATIGETWNSKGVNQLVGRAVVARLQQDADIERCRKESEGWQKCYDKASVPSGIAFLAVLRASGLTGDVALVKAIDYFPDTSRGEEIIVEVLRRGRRMLPILQFGLTHKPCKSKGDICASESDYSDFLNDLIKRVKAGEKPSAEDE